MNSNADVGTPNLMKAALLCFALLFSLASHQLPRQFREAEFAGAAIS